MATFILMSWRGKVHVVWGVLKRGVQGIVLLCRPPDVHIFGTDPSLLYTLDIFSCMHLIIGCHLQNYLIVANTEALPQYDPGCWPNFDFDQYSSKYKFGEIHHQKFINFRNDFRTMFLVRNYECSTITVDFTASLTSM